jgi:hypothetical protein
LGRRAGVLTTPLRRVALRFSPRLGGVPAPTRGRDSRRPLLH